ncbi:hypothetical protein ppKF707_0994 [Metapseudomonas furukawaii]|uniref:Uncharacterized protein n=1 Tax=Metapseudomonas furukawaii TaxID=1149133 RepID=A0AAD1C2F0_METFU|nr:hypothetical protein ppKF707_0994 [Pseudomonas furukawaii]BAU75510.1 hypothetical protein KF707C_38220 [Pseudomonas furukawaii]
MSGQSPWRAIAAFDPSRHPRLADQARVRAALAALRCSEFV